MTKDRRWLKSVLSASQTAQIELPFHRSARLKRRLDKPVQSPAPVASTAR